MSDDSESTEGAPKSKGGMIKVVVAIVLGLVVGVGGGSFVVGPLLAKKVAPASSDSTQEEGAKSEHASKEEHGEKGAKGKDEGTSPMHQVDNVVLNPAKSGGTRFLMVSAAFAVKSQAVADQLKSHDAEVRDVMLRVLGGRTVDELADPLMRDSLKVQLKVALDSMVGTKDAIRRTYFPQFVIQ